MRTNPSRISSHRIPKKRLKGTSSSITRVSTEWSTLGCSHVLRFDPARLAILEDHEDLCPLNLLHLSGVTRSISPHDRDVHSRNERCVSSRSAHRSGHSGCTCLGVSRLCRLGVGIGIGVVHPCKRIVGACRLCIGRLCLTVGVRLGSLRLGVRILSLSCIRIGLRLSVGIWLSRLGLRIGVLRGRWLCIRIGLSRLRLRIGVLGGGLRLRIGVLGGGLRLRIGVLRGGGLRLRIGVLRWGGLGLRIGVLRWGGLRLRIGVLRLSRIGIGLGGLSRSLTIGTLRLADLRLSVRTRLSGLGLSVWIGSLWRRPICTRRLGGRSGWLGRCSIGAAARGNRKRGRLLGARRSPRKWWRRCALGEAR
jgi:hypothetical protein